MSYYFVYSIILPVADNLIMYSYLQYIQCYYNKLCEYHSCIDSANRLRYTVNHHAIIGSFNRLIASHRVGKSSQNIAGFSDQSRP